MPNLWRKTAWDQFMRRASNSPLTQKCGDKTTHVSITALSVLKLISSPVLTQLRTGPKKCQFTIPIGKNHVPLGPPWTAGPHKIAWVVWCLNTRLLPALRSYSSLREPWMYRQRLYHLRQLRKFRVSPAILKTFYSGAIESASQCGIVTPQTRTAKLCRESCA